MHTAAALLALVTVASVARADEAPPFLAGPDADVAPLRTRYRSALVRGASRRSGAATEAAMGGVFLVLGGVAAASALGVALASLSSGTCGDHAGAGCDGSLTAATRERRAAIGLGIAAGASGVLGISVLLARALRLSAAPLFSSSGGGMSVGLRF